MTGGVGRRFQPVGISRDEYNYFAELRQYRNAIVHGFGVQDFDAATAASLIAAAKRILKSDAG